MLTRPIIVTAGSAYADIDVLACAVAYAELLNLIGKKASAILPAPLNDTISGTIRSWKLPIISLPPKDPAKYDYVLVDVSNPDYFEKFVLHKNIIMVYDHHYGFENHWKRKLKENAHIEEVGSCATLIWEQYKCYKKEKQISRLSANLLYTSIVSNTLNFRASITNARDLKAFKELSAYVSLPEDWIHVYYSEVEKQIVINPIDSIKKDTKKLILGGQKYVIAQLELWNTNRLLSQPDLLNRIMAHLRDNKAIWFLTIADIQNNHNYIITDDPRSQAVLKKHLSVEFDSHIGKTDKLYLRKEIIKAFSKEHPEKPRQASTLNNVLSSISSFHQNNKKLFYFLTGNALCCIISYAISITEVVSFQTLLLSSVFMISSIVLLKDWSTLKALQCDDNKVDNYISRPTDSKDRALD